MFVSADQHHMSYLDGTMYTLFSYMYWYIYLLWVQLFTYGFFSWDVYGAGLEDWAV